jgi:hypothetical protein
MSQGIGCRRFDQGDRRSESGKRQQKQPQPMDLWHQLFGFSKEKYLRFLRGESSKKKPCYCQIQELSAWDIILNL